MSEHDDMQDMGWGDPEQAKRSARKVAERRRHTRTELEGIVRDVIAMADALRRADEEKAFSEVLSRYPLRLVDGEAQSDRVPLQEEGEASLGPWRASPPADANAEALRGILASLQAIEARLDAGLQCCGTPASAPSSRSQTSTSEIPCSSGHASNANAGEASRAPDAGHVLCERLKLTPDSQPIEVAK